ncbi:hypothetical protein [Sulfurimonas sp. NW9]|uniref:hypothetical protein n=1 Tax=Sulfurimonas sp. NW9 TaxID=2922728 RepID=UPI003DAA31F7
MPFAIKIFHRLNKKYKGYNFKAFKKETIADFAEHIALHVNIDAIHKALDDT